MTPKQKPPDEVVPEHDAQGAAIPERDAQGAAIPERDAQGAAIPERDVEDETEPKVLEVTDGPIPPSTVSSPYSIDRDREQKRGWIALILVGLLAAVVLLSFAGLFTSNIELKDLKELLTVILGPLVALVGAATGFYFGEKK